MSIKSIINYKIFKKKRVIIILILHLLIENKTKKIFTIFIIQSEYYCL